jgi:hypothetical protein
MDEITKDIQGDIPWCILFADDVVLIDESRIEVNEYTVVQVISLNDPQKINSIVLFVIYHLLQNCFSSMFISNTAKEN